MQNRRKLTHFEQENGLKPHFGPFLALIGPTLGTTRAFSELQPPLPLDIISLYHKLLNWQKLMHFEHENGRKPHFGPFLALIGPILGPTKLFSALWPLLSLDITCLYHNLWNWQKLMDFEHENGRKPYFGRFLALIGPILGPTKRFFSISTTTTSRYHISLSSFAKLAKTNAFWTWKWPNTSF